MKVNKVWFLSVTVLVSLAGCASMPDSNADLAREEGVSVTGSHIVRRTPGNQSGITAKSPAQVEEKRQSAQSEGGEKKL